MSSEPSGGTLGMKELGDSHYSEKGGHKERSDFHKDVRALQKYLQRGPVYNPRFLSVEQAHIIRRSMFRGPRDGR